VGPVRFQLINGPAAVVVLRWITLILSVAFVAVGIYAFTNHAFARHYESLFLLMPPLLVSLSVIVSVLAGRSTT
jgi:hypothetical protein